MKKQKNIFTKKMEPCDYKADLALVLGENDVVVVTAKDGMPKGMKKENAIEDK